MVSRHGRMPSSADHARLQRSGQIGLGSAEALEHAHPRRGENNLDLGIGGESFHENRRPHEQRACRTQLRPAIDQIGRIGVQNTVVVQKQNHRASCRCADAGQCVAARACRPRSAVRRQALSVLCARGGDRCAQQCDAARSPWLRAAAKAALCLNDYRMRRP
ncbi:hypothetical protein D3C86_1643350 [compost metagenome]